MNFHTKSQLDFVLILKWDWKRFWKDSGSILEAKLDPKSIKYNVEILSKKLIGKNNQKRLDLGGRGIDMREGRRQRRTTPRPEAGARSQGGPAPQGPPTGGRRQRAEPRPEAGARSKGGPAPPGPPTRGRRQRRGQGRRPSRGSAAEAHCDRSPRMRWKSPNSNRNQGC